MLNKAIESFKNILKPTPLFLQHPMNKVGFNSTDKRIGDLAIVPVIGTPIIPSSIKDKIDYQKDLSNELNWDYVGSGGFMPKNFVIADDGILCVLASVRNAHQENWLMAPQSTTIKFRSADNEWICTTSM